MSNKYYVSLDKLMNDVESRQDIQILLESCVKSQLYDEKNADISSVNVIVDDGAKMPTRANVTDAGLDIYTPISFTIKPRSSYIVDTGIHIEIPKGYVGFIKSKSGLNVKHSILSEGVIDSGYTGSIVAKLYNLGDEPYTFEKHDKITQLVLLPIITPTLNLVDSFEETDRGNNGFGSTGK